MEAIHNGKQFKYPFFEAAMKICIDGLKKNPDLLIHYDIESGFPSLITKEENQAIIDLWDSVTPKYKGPPVGKVFVFGTGGNL